MLIQPEEVKTAEQRVEEARNRVTILEQDYLRIQKLRYAEEYALGEQSKVKAELDKQVSELTLISTELNTDIKKLQGVKEKTSLEIQDAEKELALTKKKAETIKSDQNDKTSELIKQEAFLSDKEDALSAREAKVVDREKTVVEKERIIKEFKGSL